jgi:hypothetical protein
MSPLQERAFIHLEFVCGWEHISEVGSFFWINRHDCFRDASCARNGRGIDRGLADAGRAFAILAKLEKGNLRCLPAGTALYARAGPKMAEAPGRISIDPTGLVRLSDYYAAFMRMSPPPSRIYMRSGAD